MNLKRVEVIGDDEGEIVEAVRRMSDNYDFVVTRLVLRTVGVAQLIIKVVELVQRKKGLGEAVCWQSSLSKKWQTRRYHVSIHSQSLRSEAR